MRMVWDWSNVPVRWPQPELAALETLGFGAQSALGHPITEHQSIGGIKWKMNVSFISMANG